MSFLDINGVIDRLILNDLIAGPALSYIKRSYLYFVFIPASGVLLNINDQSFVGVGDRRNQRTGCLAERGAKPVAPLFRQPSTELAFGLMDRSRRAT